MSSLTITCNRKESGEVTTLFMVRFPVSSSTENTSSVFPRENAKTIQPSDSFIKWPGAHRLILPCLSENTLKEFSLVKYHLPKKKKLFSLPAWLLPRLGVLARDAEGHRCVWTQINEVGHQSFSFPVPRPTDCQSKSMINAQSLWCSLRTENLHPVPSLLWEYLFLSTDYKGSLDTSLVSMYR